MNSEHNEIVGEPDRYNAPAIELSYDRERDRYTSAVDGAPLMDVPHVYVFPCSEVYRRQATENREWPDVLVEFDDWPHYVYPQPGFDAAVVSVGDTVRVTGLMYPEPDFDTMAEQD